MLAGLGSAVPRRKDGGHLHIADSGPAHGVRHVRRGRDELRPAAASAASTAAAATAAPSAAATATAAATAAAHRRLARWPRRRSVSRAAILRSGLKITVNGAAAGARLVLRVRLVPAKRKPAQKARSLGQITKTATRRGA